MSIKIKKASGQIQEFDESKLLNSLIRSGTDPEHARDVVKQVGLEIKPHMTTRKIFRLARKYLKQYNKVSVLRYSLKEALLRLGPSGYPFEKYVAELLRSKGYDVKVGPILQGRCVSHEVDVFAESDKEIIMGECKYRNSSDGAYDVKTALYVHARHEDLRSEMKKQYPGRKLSGWLVTNTRFTDDAIQFAECSGMYIVSWRYPRKHSLEKMIEESTLYPVTVLSGLNSKQIHKLIEQDMFLMKDLAKMSLTSISSLLSISDRKASQLRRQAKELCNC